MAMAASEGAHRGRMMRVMMTKSFAPSSRALSSSASGMVCMKLRRMNML